MNTETIDLSILTDAELKSLHHRTSLWNRTHLWLSRGACPYTQDGQTWTNTLDCYCGAVMTVFYGDRRPMRRYGNYKATHACGTS